MRKPQIDSTAFVAKGAVVLGNITLKKDSNIWYNATIRSVDDPIIIGEGTNIQDNAVVHTDKGYQVHIGSLVKCVINQLVVKSAEKNISLEYEIKCDNLNLIQGDKNRLRQVLINFVLLFLLRYLLPL